MNATLQRNKGRRIRKWMRSQVVVARNKTNNTSNSNSHTAVHMETRNKNIVKQKVPWWIGLEWLNSEQSWKKIACLLAVAEKSFAKATSHTSLVGNKRARRAPHQYHSNSQLAFFEILFVYITAKYQNLLRQVVVEGESFRESNIS